MHEAYRIRNELCVLLAVLCELVDALGGPQKQLTWRHVPGIFVVVGASPYGGYHGSQPILYRVLSLPAKLGLDPQSARPDASLASYENSRVPCKGKADHVVLI